VSKIAFFDFDGTITTKDTMFELIRHQKGNRKFYFGFIVNIPVFAALKLKLLSNQAAKEKLLKYFFKGTELAVFQLACDAFIDDKLPSLIRPGALEEIKKLQQQGFEITIVSASAENWIKKWADQLGFSLLATKLEAVNERLTGKLSGQNCNGAEKETRIRSAYDLSQFDEIYCYGDSGGDRQMLALGSKTFYKPFR
jgi:phosphatidylglycerophosphatase C